MAKITDTSIFTFPLTEYEPDDDITVVLQKLPILDHTDTEFSIKHYKDVLTSIKRIIMCDSAVNSAMNVCNSLKRRQFNSVALADDGVRVIINYSNSYSNDFNKAFPSTALMNVVLLVNEYAFLIEVPNGFAISTEVCSLSMLTLFNEIIFTENIHMPQSNNAVRDAMDILYNYSTLAND